MKNVAVFRIVLVIFPLLVWACGEQGSARTGSGKNAEGYLVAAYVWPSLHDDSLARRVLWEEGIGEWEIIKKGTPRFKGHYQPRVPLWGYEADNEPVAMEKKIDAATDHGVNTFIFDWYWFNDGPFLEGSVNAFVKAPNSGKMNFYLMWANHDVPGKMWNPYRYQGDSLLWKGTTDWTQFKRITERVITRYFKQPNYLKIDESPVFSIYSIANFVKSFGGLGEAKKALDYFREEVKKAGFPDLHVQLVGWESGSEPGFNGLENSVEEAVSVLGANSVTMYNMAGPGSRKEDYIRYGEAAVAVREKWNQKLSQKAPFIPVVSVGWDDTPRYPQKGEKDVVHLHSTPESFGAYLMKTKYWLDRRPEQPRMLIINAWNEWVEGSYLEPDMLWGYRYLETVKAVMEGRYDKYTSEPSKSDKANQ